MGIREGNHESPYTLGEAKALVAPLMSCTTEDLGDFIIIARSKDDKIGVFHTMICKHQMHQDCRALDLVAEYTQHLAAVMYENSEHHGPGED